MGTVPIEWNLYSSFISPMDDPINDFHSITPKFVPVSFYNDLTPGDEPIIFICKIGDFEEYNAEYRFYNNETDNIIVGDFPPGDLSNGFRLGSPVQIYNGNDYKSCTTDTYDE